MVEADGESKLIKEKKIITWPKITSFGSIFKFLKDKNQCRRQIKCGI